MAESEIIKALECCCSQGEIRCGECPYDMSATNGKWCDTALLEDTLDLISRQKAEIETMKNYEELYKELMISYCKLTDRLLERLNETREKNKHLTALVEAAEEYLQPLPFKNAFDEEIEKTKIEAIKEFKKLVSRRLNCNTPRGAYLLNIMNEVKKEMIESK